MHKLKLLRITIILAAILFIFDAFVLNQGFVSLVVILITLFVLLPRALWVYRKNRQLYLTRLTKAGIYLLAAFSVFTATRYKTGSRTGGPSRWATLAWHSMQSTITIRSN